jgi:adenylate kinase family enzyme
VSPNVKQKKTQRIMKFLEDTTKIDTLHKSRTESKTRDRLFSIFLTGPPGAGKTTQLQFIQQYFSKYCTIFISKNKTLKKEAKESRTHFKRYSKKPKKQALLNALSEQGKLVCSQMVRKKLNALCNSNNLSNTAKLVSSASIASNADHSGLSTSLDSSNSLCEIDRNTIIWVYSRGPSSIEQAKYLHDYYDITPDVYIVLEVNSIQSLIERVTYRRVDPVTQKTYSLKSDDLDENIKQRLVTRRCDDEKIFSKRMNNYKNRMEPVISYYEKLNKKAVNNPHMKKIEVVRLNADRSPQEVWRDIEGVISQLISARKCIHQKKQYLQPKLTPMIIESDPNKKMERSLVTGSPSEEKDNKSTDPACVPLDTIMSECENTKTVV